MNSEKEYIWESEESRNGILEKFTDARPLINLNLGNYHEIFEQALQEAVQDRIIQRIWEHDFSVWKPDPSEISNRLGWLDIADRMKHKLPELIKMVKIARLQGFKKAILLGMGGSSLAPEVLRKTFGVKEGYLDLMILDSTDPETILSIQKEININETLFIVATKSGTTTETLSFFKYFYNFTLNEVGHDKAGWHFIAVTDPGSKLVEIAKELDFREVFENDPNIGGRYSALSYFGLVPAALLGIDLEKYLQKAINAARRFKAGNMNDSLLLGVFIGTLAKKGKDKLTFLLPSEINSFGDWVEQLIAESTGKEGKGILPIVGEKIGIIDVYKDDRVFIHFKMGGDTKESELLKSLIVLGHPVVSIQLNDIYDLSEQFFLWEMATAIAGYCLKINPFDQPNVESSKILTKGILKDYQKNGKLFTPKAVIKEDGMSVYGEITDNSIGKILIKYIDLASPGSYVAIQAYLQSSLETNSKLDDLRIAIRDKTHIVTTLGYGPRFLHSTGQLHKGDSGRGLFIQITGKIPEDIIIPDEAGKQEGIMTFGTLESAQVLGDFQALLNSGRNVMRIDLGLNIEENLKKLIVIILS